MSTFRRRLQCFKDRKPGDVRTFMGYPFRRFSGECDDGSLRDEQHKAGNRQYQFHEDFRPLTENEIALTRRAAEIINAQIAVPCTGCSYCTDGCPMQIPIIDLMKKVSAHFDH